MLKAIKDIFKPRYALVVTLQVVPHISGPIKNILEMGFIHVPVISTLPYKRPISVPFNEFCNGMRTMYGQQSLVFYGSYRTFRNLYGIGSALKHNMKNAIVFQLEN